MPFSPDQGVRSMSLFGDPDQTDVERAIADLRSGRPVVVTDGLHTVLAMPAELADDHAARKLAAYGFGDSHLVLPRPRLHHMGAESGEGARRFPIDILDHTAMEHMVRMVGAHLDETGEAVSHAEEAALDLTRLAYLLPAVVTIDLEDASIPVTHGALKVDAGAIFAYRSHSARTMHIVSRAPVPLADAPDSEFVTFRGGEGMRDQVAIIVGRPDINQPVLTRIHSACLTGDLFGSLKCDCGDQLRGGVRRMAEEGGGIMLYLDQEGRGSGISNKMRAYRLQAEGMDTYEADEALGFGLDGRHFAMAGVMLNLLGVPRVRLLTNNPDKVAALQASGIDVVQEVRMFGRPTAENVRYLTAKRDRGGHRIGVEALFGAPAAE